jgi:glycerol-3-phosphate acyltransferase PlsY
MELAALYIYAYLVGSIPTAYIIGRLVRGIDLRDHGSGNVGGANLFSNVGKLWVFPLGVVELFVKGGSPIWIGMWWLDIDASSTALIGAPLLAIAGNNWSCYLRFTGGRGVAVTSGALLALAFWELLLFIGIAVGGWVLFRSSGVWVLISLCLLPLWSFLLGEPMAVIWFCFGLIAVTSLKRLTGNWEPLPQGLPKRQVLFNRLFKDRDYSSRDQWLDRVPGQANEGVK